MHPMPSGGGGGGGRVEGVVGGGAVGGGRGGLGAAPDQTDELAGLAVGAVLEVPQGEQAAAEAVAEASGDAGELEGDGGVFVARDGALERPAGAAGEPHHQVVDGAELVAEQAREEFPAAALGRRRDGEIDRKSV